MKKTGPTGQNGTKTKNNKILIPALVAGFLYGGKTMKKKVFELIGSAATVVLFDYFIIWALFLAPPHMAI